MDINYVLYLGRHTLETALLIAAPLLIVCMGMGIFISLFQAVTSLKDMTLTIVPKLLGMSVATLVFGNWMMQILIRFTNEIFAYIRGYGM
jgi:flagellar biosynthetic protein FliQ